MSDVQSEFHPRPDELSPDLQHVDASLRWIPTHAGLTLGFVILVSACIPIFYLWRQANQALDQEMQTSLLETTQSAALLVSGDLHSTFIDPDQEQEKSYVVQKAKLRRFMVLNPRLASLRTYIERDNSVHVILDTQRKNSGEKQSAPSQIMDVPDNPPPEVLTALREDIPLVASTPYRNESGSFIVGYAPIHNSRDEVIAVIAAEISIEEITTRKSAIRKSAMTGLGLALLCSVAAVIGVNTLRRKAAIANRATRLAQEARLAAELRYHQLFEQIPIGIINYNKDLIVTDCNQRILEIGRSKRDQLIGMNLNRLGESRLLPCLRDALQRRESVYIGEYLITEGAPNTWVEIHAGPVKDSSGEMIGGIATIEDITLKHRTEMMSEMEKTLLGMIARGEERNSILESLVRAIEELLPGSHCSLHLLDNEGKRFLRAITLSLPGEYVDMVDGIAIGRGVGSCGTAAFTGKPVITIDTKNDPLWNDYHELVDRFNLRACWSMPIMSGKDNVLGTFAVYHNEVHKPDGFEHTLIEAAAFLAGIAIEHARYEQAIFQERNLLRTLIDNLTDVIFIKDNDHRYLAANQAAINALPVQDQSQLVGKTDHDILPKEKADANHKAEKDILNGIARMEHEVARSDEHGNVHFYTINRLPLRNASGDIIGLVTMERDVTDQRHIEEERIKSQKLESLGTLAGGIAHDFNNILTSVLGNLSMINAGGNGLDTEKTEMLKEAESATQRARELTQQLLTFAKGGLPVKKPSRIDELLRESATFVSRGSSCKLSFDLPDDLWMADIDNGQISQVIQNLFFNAEDATPGGGIITITARNTKLGKNNQENLLPGKYVAVSITDQGEGIPKHLHSRIFDPYFTTKPSGNGLGLTTTFSIIKKHGGKIIVDSSEGKGATFTFYLPALAGANEPPGQKPPGSPSSHSAKILLMDDEKAILKISSRILERAGYTVVTAEDGHAAIACYKQSLEDDDPIALAILDLTIPGGMGGKEAIEHLRELDPNFRAIVSSGYSVDEVMSQYASFGFSGVVTKPYSQAELLDTISAVLTASSV